MSNLCADRALFFSAIRASMGLPPLSPPSPPARAGGSQRQPLFLHDSDDDIPADRGQDEDDSDSLPDFEDAAAVDRYFGVKSSPPPAPAARAQPPPPLAPPPRRQSPISIPRRPIQPSGWRGQPHHVIDDEDDELEAPEPEMDAELRLYVRLPQV